MEPVAARGGRLALRVVGPWLCMLLHAHPASPNAPTTAAERWVPEDHQPGKCTHRLILRKVRVAMFREGKGGFVEAHCARMIQLARAFSHLSTNFACRSPAPANRKKYGFKRR